MYKFFLKLVCIGLLIIPAQTIFASRVFVSDTLNTFPSNQEFYIDIFLDTEGQAINAVRGEILFPDDVLDFVRVRSDNSIVSTWIDPIVHNGNAIAYSGIIFNGFSSIVDPVTQEKKVGTVLRVYFKAKREGSGIIQIVDSTVYKNDGKGTPIKLKDETAVFVVSATVNGTFPSEVADVTPPEHFTPRVMSSFDVYNGKFFLIFQTVDKQSGIHHYEVKEGDTDWVEAESPYLLVNENLLQKIQVKAIDNAGNIQIEEVRRSDGKIYVYGILLLILIIFFYFLYKRIDKRNSK